MRLRITVLDVPGGVASRIVGEFASIQMTGTELRNDDDHVLLYWSDTASSWVLFEDGSEWYDWTVEIIA